MNLLDDILDGHTGEDELAREMNQVPEKSGEHKRPITFILSD